MDDFLMIRFALDNVRPRSLAEAARDAFDRVLDGQAIADDDSRDATKYERLRRTRTAGRVEGVNGPRLKVRTPPTVHLADDPVVRLNGSLDTASLIRKQEEAAASI